VAGSNRFRHRDGMLPGVVASAVAYSSRGLEPGAHRGLPSPWLTFIVSVDGPVRVCGTVAHTDTFDPATATSYDVMVAGLHPVAAVVEQPADQAGVQLALHPLAAPAVLGCRAGELVGVGDHGHEVLGEVAAELFERVAGAVDDGTRLDVVQSWVRERADSTGHRAPRPEVARAWELLHASGGRCRVDHVAREVMLSPRQLRTLVEREVGLSPKQLARGFRFSAVIGRLAAGERNLAGIAAETGYADQSHLTREFRQMAGCSPTAWLAEERRNLQDGGHRNRPE
jgi:AraC-like DNA-binding protein